MLAALIFDVDGTLAETEEAHRQAFNQAFAEFGLPWRWDRPLYRRLLAVAGGRERMRAFADALDPARRVAGLDALIPRLHRRKTEIYAAGVAAGEVPLRPGVARLLAEARAAGLRLAVATTTSRANLDALIEGTGLERFAVAGCGDDVEAKKPDPAVYHLVLDRLGLDARHCLAVEDSANGVRAALGAGVPVVVTESAYSEGDDATGALAVFPDLGRVSLADLAGLHVRRKARA